MCKYLVQYSVNSIYMCSVRINSILGSFLLCISFVSHFSIRMRHLGTFLLNSTFKRYILCKNVIFHSKKNSDQVHWL